MSVTDPVVSPAPRAKKKPTLYVVYETTDSGATLKLIHSGQQAATDIKAVDLATAEVESGDFVAIPARSLKIHTVSSTSVPKRTIS